MQSQNACLKRLELTEEDSWAVWEKGAAEEQHTQRPWAGGKETTGGEEGNEAETSREVGRGQLTQGLGAIVRALNFFLYVMEAMGRF